MKDVRSTSNDRTLVGLSGPTGAGKTTAGLHLRARGFAYARYSWVVEEVTRSAGMEPSRTTLQQVGRELHETRGQYWLGRRLLETLLPRTGCMVADGLRYPQDHEFLAESFGPFFLHIAIDAPAEIRRTRFLAARAGDNFETASTHRSESEVENVVQLAHKVITNDGSLAQFIGRVDVVVTEWLDRIGRAREMPWGFPP